MILHIVLEDGKLTIDAAEDSGGDVIFVSDSDVIDVESDDDDEAAVAAPVIGFHPKS